MKRGKEGKLLRFFCIVTNERQLRLLVSEDKWRGLYLRKKYIAREGVGGGFWFFVCFLFVCCLLCVCFIFYIVDS